MNNTAIKDSHPSYGLIGISHCQGSVNLFGSSFTNNNFVSLRIKHASRERDLSRDWYREGKEIIDIWFSSAQFVDMISSPNRGVGVPCTIQHINHEQIEKCPKQNTEREKINEDFKADLKELDERINKAKTKIAELLIKPSLTKKDRADIISCIDSISQQVSQNIPFVQKSFDEGLTRMENESKAEIEAAVSTTLKTLGLDALKSKINNQIDDKIHQKLLGELL